MNLKLLLTAFIILSSCRNSETNSTKKSSIKETQKVEYRSDKFVNSAFPKTNLLGIWTYDPNGPHADFELTEDHFYLVDYDGNGEMPYKIAGNKITVEYPDYEQVGLIKKAENDSLVIYWSSGECITYTRWKN